MSLLATKGHGLFGLVLSEEREAAEATPRECWSALFTCGVAGSNQARADLVTFPVEFSWEIIFAPGGLM